MVFGFPDWVALAPTFVLAATSLLLFLIDSIEPDPGTSSNTLLSGVATAGALGSFLVAGYFLVAGVGLNRGVGDGPISLFHDQLVVDGMSLFFVVIVGSVTALVTLASYDYLEGETYQAEYYSLVILAATGMSLMASANTLAVAFVCLELSSLPSYALVAFLKDNKGSVEAGLKYFLVGALSSAVLAYGISLVYGASGSLEFGAVAEALGSDPEFGGILGVGVIMILLGFAFKTASVPFHFWAPEAYEGAPAPISGFLSSASKAAGFVLAFRVFLVAFPEVGGINGGDPAIDWVTAVIVLSIVTMTVGNFAAATQEKVKRMLAYSSIGHAGYVLIGLAAITAPDKGFVLGASMMHLLVYGFMNTGAFLFVALTEHWGVGRTFQDFNGLSKQAPLACAAMTVFLFSLAGLPVGGGFVSKIYLLMATAQAGTWLLAAGLIVNSALSLYYYSRVVRAMWIEEPDGDLEIESYPRTLYAAIVIAAFATVVLLPAFGLLSPSSFDAANLLS